MAAIINIHIIIIIIIIIIKRQAVVPWTGVDLWLSVWAGACDDML
jgi:hypothetical protein